MACQTMLGMIHIYTWLQSTKVQFLETPKNRQFSDVPSDFEVALQVAHKNKHVLVNAVSNYARSHTYCSKILRKNFSLFAHFMFLVIL